MIITQNMFKGTVVIVNRAETLNRESLENTSTCTLYTVHCTQFTVHCTLYTVHCTLYPVHCTLYTRYSVPSTVY